MVRPYVAGEPIGYGFDGTPLYRVTRKRYRCTACEEEFWAETNHWTDIYQHRGCSKSISFQRCVCIEAEYQMLKMASEGQSNEQANRCVQARVGIDG